MPPRMHILGGVVASSILVAKARQRKPRTAPTGDPAAVEAQAVATAAEVMTVPSRAKWWWLPSVELLFAALTAFADEHKARHPVHSIDQAAVQRFCGRWEKDRAESESMDSICELFAVPRWLRQATLLVNGLDISISNDVLLVKQVCRLPWLSTTEAFPLDGSSSKPQKRRDRRSGAQIGTLQAANADGLLQLVVHWEGYMPGCACDTLQLAADDYLLTVLHEARVADRGSTAFRELYRRAG